MDAWRFPWKLAAVLAGCVLLAACAGGSGSSGFDISPSTENGAIEIALKEQRCVDFDGLQICPVNTTSPVPPNESPTHTPTATATPTVAAAVPTATHVVTPRATPSPTAASTTTNTPALSATPTIAAEPGVDLGLGRDGTAECIDTWLDGFCSVIVPFTSEGFPPNTLFRLAVRGLDAETLEPEELWTIGPPPIPTTGGMDAVSFDTSVAALATAEAAGSHVVVQLAVLVFLDPFAPIPAQVASLGNAGANYAFLTAETVIVAEAGSF